MGKKKRETASEKSYREYFSDPKNVKRDKELTEDIAKISCFGDCEGEKKVKVKTVEVVRRLEKQEKIINKDLAKHGFSIKNLTEVKENGESAFNFVLGKTLSKTQEAFFLKTLEKHLSKKHMRP